MKRFLLIVILASIHIAASAQFGNEWINYGSPYYKIPIGKDGIYRLNRSQLLAAGVPAFVNPRTIKIYHRGVEQSIYVEGENDSQLNTSDFLEFFATANDGTLDKNLFRNPGDQPHALYNLYTDTTAYFLTYGGANGKRANSAASTTANSPEAFHWNDRLVVYHDQYSTGLDYGEIQLSSFDAGEGWTSMPVFHGEIKDFIVTGITNAVSSAGVPKLEVLLTGRGPLTHNVEISAGSRMLASTSINGFNSIKLQSDLQWTDISPSGEFTLRVKVNGVNAAPARASVGYIKITFPQTTAFETGSEKYFALAENSSDVSKLQIQSAPVSSVVYDVTDPDNVLRLQSVQGATLDVNVSHTSSARRLFVSGVFITPQIKRINFREINPATQNYVIITHASLRRPVAGYTDPVKAFGEYRSLPQGGGYDTLIVNIDQLYNQFSYGETTPLAIFNFLKFLKSGKLPSYLFLIGKGLNADLGYYRNPSAFPQFPELVPTAGVPASDMKFSAGLDGVANAPGVATGRLSAVGPADVAAYLNKVKEFEALPFDNLRRKNVLHLSGGLYANEPEIFRSYLEEFATTARSYYLGGKVKAIAKRTTNIEVINVADELNQGLSLITLFGHSSPASADFDIGFVTDPVMGYNNKGKYPALLLNGCLAGSYFLNASILGENWTNSPDRGAIGVIAHSSFGFASYLRLYSNLFYKVAYGDSLFINKGLGDVQKEIAERFLRDYGQNVVPESQVQQMVLLGDPALSLFGAAKPDFAILPGSVSVSTTDGSRLNAFSDSLLVRFVVNNYGRASKQKIKISIQRTLNNNSIVTYDSLVASTLYSDTISFSIPGRIDQGYGNNNFSITIDSDEELEELNEENNKYSQIFFIPLSGTKNLYPDNFAIVNSMTPTLSFQHTDLLSEKRQFILQIDTTRDFNSDFRKEFLIESKVLASRQIDILPTDSIVYYWRTKLAQPNANENTNWEMSSFLYVNNGPAGWAQVKYGQFQENFLQGLEKNNASKRIEFKETVTRIDVIAYGAGLAEKSSVKVNGAEYNLYNEGNNFLCRENTINLIAFDKTTTQPYAGLYFTWIELRDLFGGAELLCGREPYVINSFKASEVAMDNNGDLIHYIDNVADGDSVLLFSIGNAGISTWPAEAKSKMSALGVSVEQLDVVQDGEPVVIFARKGAAPGTASIYRTTTSPAQDQVVSVSGTVTGREAEGKMTATDIGPANAWHDFIVRYKTDNPGDVVSFDVFGLDLEGKSTLLFHDVTTRQSLSFIDARVYPVLRIVFSTKDETFVTAAQLVKWIVTYEPVAEGLLLYNGDLERKTVSEGESWTGAYSFVNISEQNFADSLIVRSAISKSGTNSTTVNQHRITAPSPQDTVNFTVTFPTRNQAGINDLSVNVNPRIQPEVDFDNNFVTLVSHLKVLKDSLAPLVEVTFDGRFIVNEEVVPIQPDIAIRITDNNPFLLINDTTHVRIFIKGPCEQDECPFKPVYFSSPYVSWMAETTDTEFEVHLNRYFDSDGVYVLRVMATDASKNSASEEPLDLAFTIAHANAVSISDPYPNPFYFKTTFELLLQGETIPSDISLSIVNTRGEVVRTFSAEEFGSVHIGINTFSWEGLSEKGVPLPNGIYIYRFQVRQEDRLTTKTGKILLIR